MTSPRRRSQARTHRKLDGERRGLDRCDPIGINRILSPYEDGWRQEDFAGFGSGKWTAMPWYFRTTATWLNAISSVLDMRMVEEPLHPHTRMPVSLLMTATRR